ncbi:MAG TPA: hypothetical protein VHA75_02175 [Rugosimonospora sp.]|nr:hypothetical protein [Rugosimonospora sp.]
MAETGPSRAELVELCKAAGLPYYGSKADLVARLAAQEAAPPGPETAEPAGFDPFGDEPAGGVGNATVDPEPEEEPAAVPSTPAREYAATYPVDEWDNDVHSELCARVVAEARAAGYRTRGSGHRVSGDGRLHTYVVSVR